MSPLCFYPAIPLLDIYLVEHPSDLEKVKRLKGCLLYTSPSPRDRTRSRMPSSA